MALPLVAAAGGAIVNSGGNNNQSSQRDSPSFLDRLLNITLTGAIILIILLIVGIAIAAYYILPGILEILDTVLGVAGNILDPSGTPTGYEVALGLIFPPYAVYSIGSRFIDLF